MAESGVSTYTVHSRSISTGGRYSNAGVGVQLFVFASVQFSQDSIRAFSDRIKIRENRDL